MWNAIFAGTIFSAAAFLWPSASYAQPKVSELDPLWTECGGAAGQYENCIVPTNTIVTVRFGINGNYVFYTTQGVESVPCNGFLGDPAPYIDKKCAYTTADILGLSKVAWGGITSEGSIKQVTWGPTWVRFGTEGHYYFTLIGGGDQTKPEILDCSLGAISNNFDPYPGRTKSCQWALPDSVRPFPDAFKDLNAQTKKGMGCATEGAKCNGMAGSPVLVRYGAINKQGWNFPGAMSKYTYRMMRLESGIFPCNNSWMGFNTDPWAGQSKMCQFSLMDAPGAAAETFGSWIKIIGCDGPGCPISQNITVGTTKTNTWATTEQWSHTVTVSAEKSIKMPTGDAKVSASVANSFAHSKTFTDALAMSKTETTSVSCNPVGESVKSRALYQFKTDTSAPCIISGTCTGETKTAEYFCASNPDASYSGPRCLPGFCDLDKDPLCKVCRQ